MLIDLPIKPGVVKDNSELLSESRWVDADKIRFRNVGGKIYPEVIGGYEVAVSTSFRGKARGIHGWTLQSGEDVAAFGTNSGLYAFDGTYLWDITPIRTTGTVNNVMGTTSGSAVVRINHGSHGVTDNDTVWLHNDVTFNGVDLGTNGSSLEFVATAGSRIVRVNVNAGHDLLGGDKITVSGATATGGIASADINTTHTIDIIDSDDLVFTVSDAATSTATTTSGSLIALRAYTADYVDAANYDVTLRSGTASGTASSGGGTLTYIYGENAGLEASTSSEGARVWFLSNFADDLVANYRSSVLYRWQGNFSQPAAPVAATDAPQENLAHMVTPERFLVALGTEDATSSTYDPLRVAWAKIEGGFATNDWTPTSTNSAGGFLLAEGSKIINGVAMPYVSLIWTDTALYQIQYIESLDTVYRPTLLGTSCGLIGPNAFARAGDSGQVFWLSKTQEFMLWQGGAPISIQCPVRDFFFDNLAEGQEDKIFAGLNSKFNEIWWFYPDATDSSVIRYAALNYSELHWTVGILPVTTWLGRGVFDYPIGLHLDGTVNYHEKGDTAAGSALSPSIESGLMDAQEGHTLSKWKQFIPDFSGLTGSVTLTMKHKLRPQASETETNVGTITSATEKVDFRLTSRLVGVKFDWTGTNTAGRIGRMSFDVSPVGSTR